MTPEAKLKEAVHAYRTATTFGPDYYWAEDESEWDDLLDAIRAHFLQPAVEKANGDAHAFFSAVSLPPIHNEIVRLTEQVRALEGELSDLRARLFEDE